MSEQRGHIVHVEFNLPPGGIDAERFQEHVRDAFAAEFRADVEPEPAPVAPRSSALPLATSANTRLERLCAWLAYRLGGYGSPSLACLLLAPTLRWVWTGQIGHARGDVRQLDRYARMR